MGSGAVDGHVVDAKVKLAEGGEGVVDVFCFDEGGDEVVWDFGRWWGRRIVEGEGGVTSNVFLGFLPGGEVGGRE